ncbi:MAG: NUDIX domain-containing protein, partial [Burkholderiaceae bacterium]
MTSRPYRKVYEGYWEFPGGKVESHETAAQALQRELQEEIGVVVTTHHPAWTVSHDYAHASVDLHFYWVTSWQGNPQHHGEKGELFVTRGKQECSVAGLWEKDLGPAAWRCPGTPDH